MPNFSASNASYTPQVSVTSVTGDSSSTKETLDVPATLAGFSLTGGAGQDVFSTGEVTILSGDTFTLSQQSQQSNGTSFWETADATVETLELFSGNSPIGTNETLRLQNASERVAVAIKNVSQYKNNYVLLNLFHLLEVFPIQDKNTYRHEHILNTYWMLL